MDVLKNIFTFLLVLGFVSAEFKTTYATCGQINSDDVNAVIDATVARLMEMRHPSWGWTNTPRVILGLQLSSPRQFFARGKAIEQMETELNSDTSMNLDTIDIGKLAYYVLAVKASCQKPHNFGGKNLVRILERRSLKQFKYGESKRQIIPYDRYYRFALALGALCVNKRLAKKWIVRTILKGQNLDGSYGDIFAVADSAQMLLALKCLQREKRSRYLARKISSAIWRLKSFLRSNITADGDNVWIGSKYSSPSSVLGLKEADEVSTDKWRCTDIMKSLAVKPRSEQINEGEYSQRLPALAGRSYLDLNYMNVEMCEAPVPVPTGYQPKCNPSEPPTCNPHAVTSGPQNMINVTLAIFVQRLPAIGGIPDVNVTVRVRNGSTLYDVMTQARDDGLITFESKVKSRGQSIISIQGIEADTAAREYWASIGAATQQLLPKGISSYVPRDGEEIIFRIRTW